MATRTITSNSITFMDTSDERKLEVSVEANLPTVQIYNPNNESYTPDWETTNLVLTACVTLDLIDITDKTDNPKPSLKWYKVDDSGSKTQLSTTGKELIISSNLSGSITYICEATYYKLTANSQMTFTRVAAGANGEAGTTGENGITFQIYGQQGLVLTEDEPNTTLAVLAYDGATKITNATYQWYSQDTTSSSSSWTTISGATNSTYEISKSNVFKKTTYKCEMTYNGKTYYATATVEDKGDIYDGIINIHDIIKTPDGKCYWVLSASIYSENGETDGLLGDILRTAPDNTITEQEGASKYYYHVDIDSETPTVTLKHYNGAEWEDSTMSQTYNYMWNIINSENSENLKCNKVKIISSNDFTNIVNIVCNISDESGIQARAAISLTDTSDPIVSQTEPLNPKEGQIWIIKNKNDKDYIIKTYTNGQWIDINRKSTVHTSRPSIYNQGDFWVTSSNEDYEDTDEDKVTHPYLQGTLLVAKSGNSQYDCNDWILASAKEDFSNLITRVDNLYHYVSTDPINGLTITGRDENGKESGYSSNFRSDKLSFNYNNQERLTITTDGIETPMAEVENGFTIINGPITFGSLTIQQEANGSYSFVI